MELETTGHDITARFGKLYSAVVADVLDSLGHRNCTMSPTIRVVTGNRPIAGRAATLSVVAVTEVPSSPYVTQFQAIDALREGEIMVVAAPEVDCAFWGELISTRARHQGAVGAIVDGYSRDLSAIEAMGFGVWARGSHPADSAGRLDAIEHGVPIVCGGVNVSPGDIIVADRDGVVVVPRSLGLDVIELAEMKASTENAVRGVLVDGRSISDTYDDFGVM